MNEMSQLKLYGNYYKIFKGNGGIPEKVTVIALEGDVVTFIRGHYSKEELDKRGKTVDEAIHNMCLTKNKCKSDKILTKITPKQKQLIDEEDKKIQKMINKAYKALEEFKNGGMSYEHKQQKNKHVHHSQLINGKSSCQKWTRHFKS